MTISTDVARFAIEVDPGDPKNRVYCTGPLVETLPKEKRELWRVRPGAELPRLQEQLVHFAADVRVRGPETALAYYVENAYGLWEDNYARYEPNRQCVYDHFEPWRQEVYSAIKGNYSLVESFSILAALANKAPVLEIKADGDPVPLSILPMVQPMSYNRSLISDALTLPSFLFPICRVPWGVGAGDWLPGVEAVDQVEQPTLLLRSEDTHCWRQVEEILDHADASICGTTTAPTPGIADSSDKLASCLVLPEPVQVRNGYATPEKIYVYAHGIPGPGLSDSLKIPFRYSLQGWLWWQFFARPRARLFYVETGDFRKAIRAAREQRVRPERPLIVLAVCDSGGEIGQDGFGVPALLVGFGSRVIAPRTRITEGFAVSFIERLQNFGKVCKTPARALLAARWSLLREQQPMGLVYDGFGI